jgi:hypothetical protein
MRRDLSALARRTLEDWIIFHRWKPPCVVWRTQKMNSWWWEGQDDVFCEDVKWFCCSRARAGWLYFLALWHTHNINWDPTEWVEMSLFLGTISSALLGFYWGRRIVQDFKKSLAEVPSKTRYRWRVHRGRDKRKRL